MMVVATPRQMLIVRKMQGEILDNQLLTAKPQMLVLLRALLLMASPTIPKKVNQLAVLPLLP